MNAFSYFVVISLIAAGTTWLFSRLRKTTRLTPKEDDADLAETEQRIRDIKRRRDSPWGL
jgi:hypothetical protein